jgi:hypothetical protein
VHRDVAARNVLLTSELRGKLADFGLSRHNSASGYYRSRAADDMPLRWMAPELLDASDQQTLNKYSSATDCWAFGVMLYEMWTGAEIPYRNLPNERVWIELKNGYRLPRPATCPAKVYDVMSQCWAAEPSDRPGFMRLTVFFRQNAAPPQRVDNENLIRTARASFSSLSASHTTLSVNSDSSEDLAELERASRVLRGRRTSIISFASINAISEVSPYVYTPNVIANVPQLPPRSRSLSALDPAASDPSDSPASGSDTPSSGYRRRGTLHSIGESDLQPSSSQEYVPGQVGSSELLDTTTSLEDENPQARARASASASASVSTSTSGATRAKMKMGPDSSAGDDEFSSESTTGIYMATMSSSGGSSSSLRPSSASMTTTRFDESGATSDFSSSKEMSPPRPGEILVPLARQAASSSSLRAFERGRSTGSLKRSAAVLTPSPATSDSASTSFSIDGSVSADASALALNGGSAPLLASSGGQPYIYVSSKTGETHI